MQAKFKFTPAKLMWRTPAARLRLRRLLSVALMLLAPPLIVLAVLRPFAVLPPLGLSGAAASLLYRRRLLTVRTLGLLALAFAGLLVAFGVSSAPSRAKSRGQTSLLRPIALSLSPLFLALVIRVVGARLPWFGLVDAATCDARSEEATARSLEQLAEHVRDRGVPRTVSAHARARLRGGLLRGLSGVLRGEAARWLVHGRLGLHGLAADGFYIDADGRRVDLATDSEGSDDDAADAEPEAWSHAGGAGAGAGGGGGWSPWGPSAASHDAAAEADGEGGEGVSLAGLSVARRLLRRHQKG